MKNMVHNIEYLKDFSSAFSRRAFVDVMDYNDYSHIDWLLSKYSTLKCLTYSDWLRKAYAHIVKNYRCEYVYKNELIKLLLSEYGTKNTVYFNEFRAGSSIADMAMFNGESKAFEIKTEYDSPQRLDKQLDDYMSLFDRSYIVIPETKVENYQGVVNPAIGIIVMYFYKGKITLNHYKEAEPNTNFNHRVLMSCLRTEEYKNIVLNLGGSLDGVSGYDMFTHCSNIISASNPNEVKPLFLQEVKKRKNTTSLLKNYPAHLRQMLLSLNLSKNKAENLLTKLNVSINQI